MKREVTRALALCFAQPKLERLERLLVSRRANHFDETGRSTNQCGPAGRFMRVLGEGPHERQINVHMWVDETGKDIFTRRIDHFVRSDVIDGAIDARDRLVLAENVRDVPLAGRNNFAVFDEKTQDKNY